MKSVLQVSSSMAISLPASITFSNEKDPASVQGWYLVQQNPGMRSIRSINGIQHGHQLELYRLPVGCRWNTFVQPSGHCWRQSWSSVAIHQFQYGIGDSHLEACTNDIQLIHKNPMDSSNNHWPWWTVTMELGHLQLKSAAIGVAICKCELDLSHVVVIGADFQIDYWSIQTQILLIPTIFFKQWSDTYCADHHFLRKSQALKLQFQTEKIVRILKLTLIEFNKKVTAVAWKESTQVPPFVSTVSTGPWILKASKSNLRVQMSVKNERNQFLTTLANSLPAYLARFFWHWTRNLLAFQSPYWESRDSSRRSSSASPHHRKWIPWKRSTRQIWNYEWIVMDPVGSCWISGWLPGGAATCRHAILVHALIFRKTGSVAVSGSRSRTVN